ncbi:hypothetical protein MANES_06G004900v8 [Manihot esculenta]|uniref:Uncharacterized protein n=1 Tax=Manihot esculenta TaxID=3983 RepID=A0ACB7HHG2_MANES|nr:hypothetical protein MANES_06G004900v8 [Manihot esculenta]
MLENPGKFLCNFSSLKVGQRIYGVSADEDLQRHQLYFLLPMKLLYSVLTHDEMASLTSIATAKAFKNSNLAKIFPVFSEFCIFQASEMKRMDHVAASTPWSDHNDAAAVNDDDDESKVVDQRFFKQRSWRPALETIVETPCISL